MTSLKPILVIGEATQTGLSATTKEVLHLGRRIADTAGQELWLCLLGKQAVPAAEQGFAFGADQVEMATDPLLDAYLVETWLIALKMIIEAAKPGLVLFGHTDLGLELAPRLAFRLKTGAALDCTDILVNGPDQPLTFVKPVFGGKAVGRLQLADRFPQIATLREGAVDPLEADTNRNGSVRVTTLSLDARNMRVRIIGKQVDENLAMANRLLTSGVVVCAGRGAKNKEGVALLTQTAELLKGAIAATRPVVDNGWLPYSLQVGLTGKKVHPQLYIAAGISGAIQHMTGCIKSKTIVAINNDEAAPVFKMAHFGVVGDLKQVITGFNEEIQK